MNISRLPRQKNTRDGGWLAGLFSMNYADDLFSGIYSYGISIVPGRSRAIFTGKKKKGSLLQQGP